MRRMELAVVLMAAGVSTCVGVLIAADEKPAADSKVTVQIASWQETLKLAQSHRGQVVVLDAWSTSCQPCMKEFPHLVELHKQHSGKGLVCMSFACDYVGIKNKPPEYYQERVLKFLTKQQATFKNILSNVPSDELFEKEMQIGAIPAVYVFGRDGKLVKRFDNDNVEKEEDVFTYKEVTKLVEELLTKTK